VYQGTKIAFKMPYIGVFGSAKTSNPLVLLTRSENAPLLANIFASLCFNLLIAIPSKRVKRHFNWPSRLSLRVI